MIIINQYSLFIFSLILLIAFAVAFGYLFTENNLQNIFCYILFFVIPLSVLISFFINYFSNSNELTFDKFAIVILICLIGFPVWLNGIYDFLANSYFALTSVPVAGDFLNSVMAAITGTNQFTQENYNNFKTIYQQSNIYYFVTEHIDELHSKVYNDEYTNMLVNLIYYLFNLVYFIFIISAILMVVGND